MHSSILLLAAPDLTPSQTRHSRVQAAKAKCLRFWLPCVDVNMRVCAHPNMPLFPFVLFEQKRVQT